MNVVVFDVIKIFFDEGKILIVVLIKSKLI